MLMNIPTFTSSIAATHQSPKNTIQHTPLQDMRNRKKLLALNKNVMTCFYTSMAIVKSSENSLDDDNNGEPISTQKHIYIYRMNAAMSLSL
jgi:hypothetical protein